MTCDPVGYPHWSSFCLKGCTTWKGPHTEAEEECEEVSPEEEGVKKKICVELTTVLTPHSSVLV